MNQTEEAKEDIISEQEVVTKVLEAMNCVYEVLDEFKANFEKGNIRTKQDLQDQTQVILAAAYSLSLSHESREASGEEGSEQRDQSGEEKDGEHDEDTENAEDDDTLMAKEGPCSDLTQASPSTEPETIQNPIQLEPFQEQTFRADLPKISLELSDYYETLPEEFQNAIPKRHPFLLQFIREYQRLATGTPIKQLDKEFKLLSEILSAAKLFKCKYCFMICSWPHTLASHVRANHSPPYSNRVVPHKFIPTLNRKFICPAVCGFIPSKKYEVLEHIVLYHSQRELPFVSREYCKFLLGWDYKPIEEEGGSFIEMGSSGMNMDEECSKEDSS